MTKPSFSPPLTRARARALARAGKERSLTTFVGGNAPTTSSSRVRCTSAKSRPDSLMEGEAKKMKLSKDELAMNGAPEGDIFDVKVLSDEELIRLNEPETQIEDSILKLKLSSSSWADRYAAIEVLRRLSLHNSNLVSYEVVESTVSAVNVELDSLRSCSIRNGALCLNSFLKIPACKSWILSKNGNELYSEVIGKLILKACTGPKFLRKAVSDVLQESANALPFSRLCLAFLPYSANKNSDVCEKAYVIVAERFLSESNSIFTEADEDSVFNSLQFFQKGLTAVKPISRELSKNALQRCLEHMGFNSFNNALKKHFTEEHAKEIVRSIKKSDVRNMTASCRKPLRPLKESSVANNAASTDKLSRNFKSTNHFHDKPWKQAKRSMKVNQTTGCNENEKNSSVVFTL